MVWEFREFEYLPIRNAFHNNLMGRQWLMYVDLSSHRPNPGGGVYKWVIAPPNKSERNRDKRKNKITKSRKLTKMTTTQFTNGSKTDEF